MNVLEYRINIIDKEVKKTGQRSADGADWLICPPRLNGDTLRRIATILTHIFRYIQTHS